MGGLNGWFLPPATRSCHPPPEMERWLSRWLNRWQRADFLNLHLNLNTRTRHLMAET